MLVSVVFNSSSFGSFHHKYFPLINIWQCALFMFGWNGTRNNMVVDVNEMGVKHTCRFLLGQRWRSKLCWRRSLSICRVKVGLSFYRNQTYSVETYLFFLFMTMLDENKCMWSVDLMPCWMETWFMWCYCFCAGIFVSINGWKKMGWIGGLNFYLGCVYSAQFG